MSENESAVDHAAKHKAANLLYQEWSKIHTLAVFSDEPDSERCALHRKWLVEQLEKAKASLEAHDKGIAFFRAIDALLPNWKYVDASDFLPKHLWGQFISDDPVVWVQWLTDHKVPAPEATRLVDQVFGAVQ